MDELWNKIYSTLIVEDRYLFFLEGLKNTLILTFASFLLGTLLGVLFCAGRRSRNNVISGFCRVLTSFFMEMPTLVLLMVLVYVVFGSVAVPVMWAVTIGLTLKAGAYLSQIFLTALSTVAGGEMEAARTLGMTRWQAFRYVALPQTVVTALPLYKNQFIAAMQETSVVGTLAIMDLTRASSVVSSRTLDSLFGLILVSVMYFAIGGVMKGFFKLLMNKLQPKGGDAA